MLELYVMILKKLGGLDYMIVLVFLNILNVGVNRVEWYCRERFLVEDLVLFLKEYLVVV